MKEEKSVNRCGRPRKSFEVIAQEVVHILTVANALYLKQWGKLQAMGFTQKSAEDFVAKKRRGLVGDLVGNEVVKLIDKKSKNLTVAAARLVIEHDMPVAMAVNAVLRTEGKGRIDIDRAEAFRGAVRQKIKKLPVKKIDPTSDV